MIGRSLFAMGIFGIVYWTWSALFDPSIQISKSMNVLALIQSEPALKMSLLALLGGVIVEIFARMLFWRLPRDEYRSPAISVPRHPR